MPEVTFSPVNQCTLDDPTDGAAPATDSAPAAQSPNLDPSCQTPTPGAGGRPGDECTDALVRRFSEGGAPATGDAPSVADSPKSCFDETLRALQTCSPLLLASEGTPAMYVGTQALGCAAAVASLVECIIPVGDAVH